MSTNPTRAHRAKAALQHYVLAKGDVFEGNGDEAADLIADLLHFVSEDAHDSAEDNVEQVLHLARLHFDAEHGNPEEEGEPITVHTTIAALESILPYAENELASLREAHRRDGGLEAEVSDCEAAVELAGKVVAEGRAA